MNLHNFIDHLYNISPFIYNLQLSFFNGNHFKVLKRKLENIPTESILEIGCGTAPILKEFHPKKYMGVDIEEKFVLLARNKYSNNKNYTFIVGDGRDVDAKDKFDVILFSHTTHHLTDNDILKLLRRIKDKNFKHIVIYDGRPVGLFSPLLTRLDYGAAKFRKVEDFFPLIDKSYEIKHFETFRVNRPFYEYQLIILSKKIENNKHA